jgi:hypothetical protein
MIPIGPGTNSASVPQRWRPECLRRSYLPRAQRRAAKRESASSRETRTSVSLLRTAAEMKEKYGDTLRVDGVVGEDDDKSVDESMNL